MDPSGHLLPLGDSPAGQLGRCPRLAGIPPPEGPMTPPPYPPVTAAAPPAMAAPAAPAAPPVTAAPPATAVASTQATFQIPHREGADDPSKVSALKKGRHCRRCPRRRPGSGGAGDSSGRSGRATSREPRTAQSRSKKRRRSQSRKRDSRPMAPFPLQDHEGRLQALQALYEEAGEHKLASEITALRGLQVSHPEMGADELQRLNNQVSS